MGTGLIHDPSKGSDHLGERKRTESGEGTSIVP